MEELRLGVKDKQNARMALLRYYSSECMAHGAYLLALAVAFLGFVEATPYALEFVTSVFSSTLSEKFVTGIILSSMVSGLIFLAVYVLGRIVVWGYLRSAILKVKPKTGSEVMYDWERITVTFMLQLHVACLDYVKKRHGIWAEFYGLEARRLAFIWFNLFVVFFIVFLLLLSM